MNERIDEVMIQAGARFEFLHDVHYDDFQYRKFAELIIMKCADIAQSTGEHGYIASQEMFEYFGVEK